MDIDSVFDATKKALTAAVSAAKELLVAAGCGASRERRDAAKCALDCAKHNREVPKHDWTVSDFKTHDTAIATCVAECASSECELLQQGLETAEASLSAHVAGQASSAASAAASLAVVAAVATAAMLF